MSAWKKQAVRTWSNKGTHWSRHKYDAISKKHVDYIKEYRVWQNMVRRCTDPKCDMYKHYGGRGIKICDRWLDEDQGFVNFYRDMGPRPYEPDGKAYQIDRIDVDGNYCPENCRWVTGKQNARNCQHTIRILLYGDEYCLMDVCKMFGLERNSISRTVKSGRKDYIDTIADALIRKNNKRARNLEMERSIV